VLGESDEGEEVDSSGKVDEGEEMDSGGKDNSPCTIGCVEGTELEGCLDLPPNFGGKRDMALTGRAGNIIELEGRADFVV
jgi:hypothetical protein